MGRFKKRVVQEIVNLRKKNFVIQKLVAGILIVALLAGQAGTIDVFADTNTDAEAVDIRRVITSFEELPEAVREQSVPVGTEPEALVLPDTLEVSVQAVAENPEKVESPEVTESPTPTPTESPEATESPSAIPEENPEEAENPSAIPTENPEEAESPSAIPTENPEEAESPSAILEESSEAAENPASTESPGNADNLIPTENPEETEEPENDTQTEDTGEMEKETVTVALNEVYSSLSEESVMETLTISKTVTIEGVTWISMPEYEGEAAGEYIFTAVLPQGYVLAECVCLPQIKVIVADGEQAVMTQISRWHFDEADVYPKGDLLCDEGSYSLVLAGGSSEVQIPLDEIISIFPESVTVEYADLNAGNN